MTPMERIGRYRIIGELGRGAMGVVYHAIDPSIGRPVAIKTIRLGDFTDPEERTRLRERLFREARSAGILSHPGIVTIYDMEEHGGEAYIAMEFVNGPTLEQILSGKEPLEQERTLRILRQAAAALDYAHQKGIVHRDIKPANIMLDESGAVKIADFGVAKISASEQFTQAGMILGTPNYISPEQVQGLAVDGRADQFSLTVVAFELLTGERPFAAEHLTTVVYKIVAEEPIAPLRLNPSLGPRIDAVLRKGLSKKPEARYPACSELVSALEAACASTSGWKSLARGGSLSMPTLADVPAPVATPEPLPPRPVPELPPFVRRQQAEERSKAPMVVAVLVALALLGWAGWSAARLWDRKPSVETASNTATPTPTSAPQLAPEPSPTPTPAPPETAPEKKAAPRESVPPPRERPSLAPQRVQITSEPPGASAVIDDLAGTECRTPCSFLADPGRHTVSVRLNGHQNEFRQITVGNNPVEVPTIRLRMPTGALMLSSSPSGASIRVDDRSLEQKTPAELQLAPGRHRITIEKDGMERSEQVDIRQGGTSYLKIALGQQAEPK